MNNVSVIVPSINMGRFLGDAVASIARQDRPVAEIIVIDGNSNDGTPDVVRRLSRDGAPIRMLQSEPRGPGIARNEGIAAARGNVIAFLDADDLWPKGKLARQLDYLEARPNKGMVSGFVSCFDKLDATTLAPAEDARIETLFHVHLGACLYRRQVFDEIGPFNEGLLYAEDVDLLLRVREAAIDFTILRAVMLYYRRHGNSMMTQKTSRKQGDFRRAVAMSLMRRRAAGKPPIDQNMFESFLEVPP